VLATRLFELLVGLSADIVVGAVAIVTRARLRYLSSPSLTITYLMNRTGIPFLRAGVYFQLPAALTSSGS
jgi:hypothetical protein